MLTDPALARIFDEARRVFESLGHTLVEVSLPHTAAAVPTYYVVASAEASTNLSRYDGVRYGHRCEAPVDLTDLYERSRSEGFGARSEAADSDRHVCAVGRLLRCVLPESAARAPIDPRRLRHSVRLGRCAADADRRPSVAFPIGQISDPVEMYQQDVFTVRRVWPAYPRWRCRADSTPACRSACS